MPGGYRNLAGRVGSGQEVFQISRGGSDRVKRFLNVASWVGSGWVGSGQEVIKCRESGRVYPDPV